MGINEENILFSKLKSDINNSAILKECFLKDCLDDCSDSIINAHSLQRMGSLSILEANVNGNQCIYALTETTINPRTGLFELKPIGKQKASTFFGICQKHDSLLFKPIEENVELIDLESDEHCFLFSLRAFAISYHRKKEDIKLLSNTNQSTREKIRKYYKTNNIESLLEGSKLGLLDLEQNKNILVSVLTSKDYSCLDFFTYEINHTAPIAMCMSTSPPYLFNGQPMNISADPKYKYSDIMTSVIPLKDRTLIILASFKSDPFGTTYLDELNQMNGSSLEKALSWHILTNAENCFFSPKWYQKLNPIQKHFISELSQFSSDVSTPYLKYHPERFEINLLDSKSMIR